MKAYQIVDFDNPVSVSYSKISQDSFRPAIEKGYISEIIPVQAVTPKNLHKYEDMFNWENDLAQISGYNKQITPTEKSGNISHWLLMKQASETDERFFIMEHDALMLNSFNFKMCMDVMNEHDMSYANLGMFMSCYSYNKGSASWMYDQLIRENNVPVNCGPYLMAEKLYKLYAKHYLSKRDYLGKKYSFLQPFRDHEKLGYGRTERQMFHTINFTRETYRAMHPYMKTPSTQCWSDELGLTQNHHNYGRKHNLHPFFKRL